MSTDVYTDLLDLNIFKQCMAYTTKCNTM